MSQVENNAVEEQEEEEDFLSGVTPQDVPLACSIDNPDCEACQ
jgi:hypothetical protein